MKSKVQALQRFFTEFCDNSTIHGVRYFTQKKTHWTERFWWTIAFGFSVCLCGYSIQHIWVKWHERPILMSISDKDVQISAIPFPVVTICPQTKTTKDKLDLIGAYHLVEQNAHKNLTDIELTRLEILSHICKYHLPDHFHLDEKYINESIYSIIEDMAPSFEATMDSCEWQYNYDNCSKYFSPIFTREGICYTFNDLNSHDIYTNEMTPEMMTVKNKPDKSQWSYENGYETTIKGNEYPFRLFNTISSSALNIYLHLFERDFESLCKQSIPGYKLMISLPGDSLEMSRHYIRVPVGEKVTIMITAQLITTSKELRRYDPNQRGCFYSSERKLRFFKEYVQTNCEAECLANYTVIQCGCVRFSMPREKGVPICGSANIRCYQNAEQNLFGEDIIDGLKDNDAKAFRLNCNCLPSCTRIIYDADVDRAPFDFEAILKAYETIISMEHYTGVNPSNVLLHFKDFNVVANERMALYTYSDFLSICGGLLGLFLGVSALSIVEFIYYSTLRLYWKIRHVKNSRKVTFKRYVNINRIRISTIDSIMHKMK